MSGFAPLFEVRDITSPFGILRDSIPIPGDVIQAMGDSIAQIQSNFPPTIFIGPPSSLTFTVDEGRGLSTNQSFTVMNTGVYGSLLGVVATTSAGYVLATPATLGNLASNETGIVGIKVDSTNLLASNSPYTASIVLQDADATNTPQSLPVTIVVRPKATVATSVPTLYFTVVKPSVGAFPTVPSQQFLVQNTGVSGSVLNFEVQKLTSLSADWLAGFAPVTGTLNAATSQIVTVSVAPIQTMMVGTFQETLRISGYSTNTFVDVLIQLTII